jgi:hypothetical protein
MFQDLQIHVHLHQLLELFFIIMQQFLMYLVLAALVEPLMSSTMQ